MATMGDYLNSNGVHTNQNMNAGSLLSTLEKIPSAVLSLIPGLGAAITALKTANTALTTAHKAYVTASTDFNKAKTTLDNYNAAQATAKGDPSGAAYTSQLAVKTTANAALTSAQNSVISLTSSTKTAILNTQVPGT